MRNNKGFSLVELIIVIAIMAVLVGVVGTQVIPYLENSRQAKDIQVLSSFATAGVMAYASHPDGAPTDNMTVTITDNGGADEYTCDVANTDAIVDEFKTLIGKDIVSDVNGNFQSKKYRNIAYLKVYYDFDNHSIIIYAYDSSNILINNDVNIQGIL